MKKSNLLLAAAALMLLFTTGCGDIITSVNADSDWNSNNETLYGSGRLVELEMDFSGFLKIEQHYSFETKITKGSEYSVIIRIDDNLEEHLDAFLTSGTMVLSMENGYNYKNAVMEAEITMPDVESLLLSGASLAEIDDFNFAHDFYLDLSGASRVEGSISTGDVNFYLSGASSVELEGTGKNFNIRCSGASDANLSDFAGINADVYLSGSSVSTVQVTGNLTAGLSGASVLYYLGNPSSTDFSTSGESKIIRL